MYAKPGTVTKVPYPPIMKCSEWCLLVSIKYHKLYWAPDKEEYTALLSTISHSLSTQTLWCGYTKESSQWDDSFEYPQHRVRGYNKDFRTCKNSPYLELCYMCICVLFMLLDLCFKRYIYYRKYKNTKMTA